MLLRWLLAALLVLTGASLVSGALAPAELGELASRLGPILGFVVAMTVVAELASVAGVFEVLARRVARAGRGRTWALWAAVVVLATLTTVFLSLDTTAVLLTPVVVVLARACGLAPLPFALTTVWLANTASLLLPVSNLSNLLAQQHLQLSTGAFVTLTWSPALVGVVVPTALLAVIFRRRLAGRYRPPAAYEASDPTLLRGSVAVLVLLVPALVSGAPVWIPAVVAAGVLVVLFAHRRREVLTVRLVPAVPVLLTLTLFVLVSSLNALGLTEALAGLAGAGEQFPDLLRLAGVTTMASNLANNLPAYIAFEPVAGEGLRLVTVLIATNLGALITPTASLATLLWFDRLRALRVRVDRRGFALLGALAVLVTVPAAVLALSLAR